MVTSQPTRTTMQPPLRGRDPCDMLILRTTSLSCSSPIHSFIVPRSLSATWSTKTMLPMANQVVAPPVQDLNSPSSLVCGHSSITLTKFSTAFSSLCSVLPRLLCLVRCDCSHGSRVTNSPRQSSYAVVWLSVPCLVILSLSMRHACTISFSRFLIFTSINMLFFLSRTQSSTSS